MSDIERDEIITLRDEDGTDKNYVVVDGVEYNGKDYLALVEEAQYNEEKCEFIILRVDESVGDECILATIEDEDEFNEVMALLDEKLDDEEFVIDGEEDE